MRDEFTARQRAITLRLSGRSIKSICSALGRSALWFHKWGRRYLESGAAGLYDLTRANHQVARRKPQSFRPTLMALEQRDCPATATFSAGELLVLGTAPQGQTIQVATQGQDLVVTDGQHEIWRQAANTVSKLTVATGAGPDNVTIHLTETGNVLAQSLQVQIDTGAGNDTVTCTCENIATAINANVKLGSGNDTLSSSGGTSVRPR